jgi:asparagine synthase (glutamine-hydrolysing)
MVPWWQKKAFHKHIPLIFGSFAFSDDSQHPAKKLKSIEDNLAWKNAVAVHYNHGAFHGTSLTDPRLPQIPGELFFHDEENGLLVMIDGFIYNLPEIAHKLAINGHPQSPAALVAMAFTAWGNNFANRLNGDFAICICREKEQELLFYRDHLGIRPLAVALMGPVAFFATDMTGLSRALFNKEKIDPAFLLNLFLHGGHDFSLLPHKGVCSVKPGHYLRVTRQQQEQVAYWFPHEIQTNNTLTWPVVREELDHLLKDAVRLRADTRFTASAHLSGGLDSTIVAALARQEYAAQKDFFGYSWAPGFERLPELQHDERLLVEQTCRQYDITPVYANFNTVDYDAFTSNWRNPSEMVFERRIVDTALSQGVNLIFSGWGGDEFISISDRGIDADLIRSLDWKSLLKKYTPWHPRKFLAELQFAIQIISARNSSVSCKSEKEVYPYIRKALCSNRIPRRKRFSHRSRRNVHLQLIRLGHIAARTADWYVNGQRHGIEYRYPLLDKRIVEFMLMVPSRCLVSGNRDRIILRELGKGLVPPGVLKRTSKDDLAITQTFRPVAREAKLRFAEELETFLLNPDLGFVDADRLRKELPAILSGADSEKGNRRLAIFYYLKKAHEFTRGYYETHARIRLSEKSF